MVEQTGSTLKQRWQAYKDPDGDVYSFREVLRGKRAQPVLPRSASSVEEVLAGEGWSWRDLDRRSAEATVEAASITRERLMIESPIRALLSEELAENKANFHLLANLVAEKKYGGLAQHPIGRSIVDGWEGIGSDFVAEKKYGGLAEPLSGKDLVVALKKARSETREEFKLVYDVEAVGKGRKQGKRVVPVSYGQDFDYSQGRVGPEDIVNFIGGEIDSINMRQYSSKPRSEAEILPPIKQFLNHFLSKDKTYGSFAMHWTDITTDPKLQLGAGYRKIDYIYDPAMNRFETKAQECVGTEVEFIEPELYAAMLRYALDSVPLFLDVDNSKK